MPSYSDNYANYAATIFSSRNSKNILKIIDNQHSYHPSINREEAIEEKSRSLNLNFGEIEKIEQSDSQGKNI